MNRNSINRILDANCNRAAEGLRVIEDICRFVFDSQEYTEQLKSFRHQLIDTINRLDPTNYNLLAGRKSDSDVGEKMLPELERDRMGFESLIVANFRRVQEATRVLEEISKLVNPHVYTIFKQIRFQLYTLEKNIILLFPKGKLTSGELYVVTDQKLAKGRPIVNVVKQAIAGGATIIQLRDKEAGTRMLVEQGKRLRRITRENNVLLIINDRVDIALAVDADGVHLGQDDMAVDTARKLLGYDKIIGVSVSNLEQAIQAEKSGADYLGLSPIYTTSTKPDAGTGLGLTFIRQVRRKVKLPLVAIGGINKNNVTDVIRAGADIAAVVSAVVSAEDIEQAARDLVKKIKKAKTISYR
ncbi:MAG: thiamine phosphate synthase [bacterium]|nr:thiamine phosphate synthase [bacterium]